MRDVDDARRSAMRAAVGTLGAVLVLLAVWSNLLGVPSPLERGGAPAVEWGGVSVAGMAFILGAIAWWLADRGEVPTKVTGNCRECGSRFEADFCLRCGSTRMVTA